MMRSIERARQPPRLPRKPKARPHADPCCLAESVARASHAVAADEASKRVVCTPSKAPSATAQKTIDDLHRRFGQLQVERHLAGSPLIPTERQAMITPNAGLPVAATQLLGITRSSFYYQPRLDIGGCARSSERLDRFSPSIRCMGSRRLQATLLQSVGRRRVRRLIPEARAERDQAEAGAPAGRSRA